MSIEEKYEDYLLKAKIMNVAAQLMNDNLYSKEDGAQELESIVEWLEGRK